MNVNYKTRLLKKAKAIAMLCTIFTVEIVYQTYRIYPNKRRGAYLIFRPQVQRLFEGRAYLNIVPDKSTFSIFLFNGILWWPMRAIAKSPIVFLFLL